MNFNLTALIAFTAGMVLIYAAIKDRDPRDVVKDAMTGKANPGARAAAKPASATVPNNGGAQPITIPAIYPSV